MELKVRNVNEAFERMVTLFHRQTPPVCKGQYRNPNGSGEVLYIPEPVTLTYGRPWERVLLNHARDANPFFHLYEALWMLAGRNDVAPLKYYCSDIGRYSDDGITANGAYGYRWRHHKVEQGTWADQLYVLINHLGSSPESRRAVLQMWNVEHDLLKVDSSKDVCCNLSVMFSVRREEGPETVLPDLANPGRHNTMTLFEDYLDMTVTNRSNDLILGMLGTNAVHFSLLQEYVADRLGVQVGRYHQFSNNVHIYLNDRWKPKEWLEEYGQRDMHSPPKVNWDNIEHIPLKSNSRDFDKEVREFVQLHRQGGTNSHGWIAWDNEFLAFVAQPMLLAYHAHKVRSYAMAEHLIHQTRDDAWRQAGAAWLKRRVK